MDPMQRQQICGNHMSTVQPITPVHNLQRGVRTLEKDREALCRGCPSTEASAPSPRLFRSRAIDLRRVMSISSTMSPTALHSMQAVGLTSSFSAFQLDRNNNILLCRSTVTSRTCTS